MLPVIQLTWFVENLHVRVSSPHVQEDRVVIVGISIVTTRMIRHVPNLIDCRVRCEISTHVVWRPIPGETFLALVQFMQLLLGQTSGVQGFRVQTGLPDHGVGHPLLQAALREAHMRLDLRGRLGQTVRQQLIGDLVRDDLRGVTAAERIRAIRIIVVNHRPVTVIGVNRFFNCT